MEPMDMDDYLPFVIFGGWTLLVGALMLASRRSLRRLVRERIAVYGSPHVWQEASELEFPRLKRDFYDACQAALESAGFKAAGDIVDATLAATRQNPHTFRRVMFSSDGSAVAEFWQINYRPWKQLFHMLGKGLGDARFIRIFSEAEDGRLFAVVRSPEKLRSIEPDKFEIVHLDGKPAADELWARFTAEFAEYQRARPDFVPRRFKFTDDAVQSETRQQQARVAQRKIIGLLTRDELRQMGMQEKSVDSYLKAFSRQLRKMGGWPGTIMNNE